MLDKSVLCASGSVGGAPPCQGGGRGFESRLALLLIKRTYPKWICPFLINEAHTALEGSRSRLPARSVLLLRRGVHWTPAPRLAQMSVMSPYSRRARGTQGVQLWYGCCFRCTVSPFIS